MPVNFTRLANSNEQVFRAARASSPRPTRDLTLHAEQLQASGWLTVPGHIWRTLQRLGSLVEPVLVAEWARLTGAYAERMGRAVPAAEIQQTLRWLDPARDTLLARHVAHRLMTQGQPVTCVWTGAQLRAEDLDIDHCLPWSAWPCGDLWNLLPARRRVNQHQKRDRLPSTLALADAQAEIIA